MGCIPPIDGFLQGLRDLCDAQGIVLILTKLCVASVLLKEGQQNAMASPDMVTMGKIIGGGMPVGAFGGKKEIMAMVAPEGPVYQAGTLSGNQWLCAADSPS